MTYLIVLAVGVAVGAAVVAWTDRYINAESKWTLATAQKVREQADEMLATAEVKAVRAEALTTPTGEYLAVKPKVTVRLGYRLARDWARDVFTPEPSEPDWAPGELTAALAPRPPLRVPSGVPARRRFTRPIGPIWPTPAQVAARLARIADPTRAWRVKVLF